MPDTFVKIASVTVGSGGASSIDFTSIPQTYTDLCIKLSARGTGTSNTWTQGVLYPNGSSSNLSYRAVYGVFGTTTGSETGTGGGAWFGTTVNNTANTFATNEIYIPNYTSSAYKSYSTDSATENNATSNYMALIASLWSSTAAITSIELKFPTVDFVQYSTATLYGIKNS